MKNAFWTRMLTKRREKRCSLSCTPRCHILMIWLLRNNIIKIITWMICWPDAEPRRRNFKSSYITLVIRRFQRRKDIKTLCLRLDGRSLTTRKLSIRKWTMSERKAFATFSKIWIRRGSSQFLIPRIVSKTSNVNKAKVTTLKPMLSSLTCSPSTETKLRSLTLVYRSKNKSKFRVSMIKSRIASKLA